MEDKLAKEIVKLGFKDKGYRGKNFVLHKNNKTLSLDLEQMGVLVRINNNGVTVFFDLFDYNRVGIAQAINNIKYLDNTL